MSEQIIQSGDQRKPLHSQFSLPIELKTVIHPSNDIDYIIHPSCDECKRNPGHHITSNFCGVVKCKSCKPSQHHQCKMCNKFSSHDKSSCKILLKILKDTMRNLVACASISTIIFDSYEKYIYLKRSNKNTYSDDSIKWDWKYKTPHYAAAIALQRKNPSINVTNLNTVIGKSLYIEFEQEYQREYDKLHRTYFMFVNGNNQQIVDCKTIQEESKSVVKISIEMLKMNFKNNNGFIGKKQLAKDGYNRVVSIYLGLRVQTSLTKAFKQCIF